MTLISENKSLYKDLIDAIIYNRNTYSLYCKDVKAIVSTASEEFCLSFGFKLEKFLKYEEYLFQKNILNEPQTDVVVRCKATYSSPQGRNYYWKEETYSFIELNNLYNCYNELKKQKEARQTQIRIERARMTDSLRYDILKRDNFKCQICGSTVNDGVKLHVDHIIPVSKGGKTESINLRTLCDRCNMGKSDKI